MQKRTFHYFLLFILMVYGSSTTPAQSPAIDSLRAILTKSKEDTARVNILGEISFQLQFTDPDEGLKTATQALALSEKLGWKPGIAHATKLQGIHHFRKSEYSQAFMLFNSCLKQYEALGDRKGIAKSLGNLGNIYLLQTDYPRALQYYLDEVKILEQLKEKAELAGIMGNIGIIYFNTLDYSKSLEYYTRSLKLNEELGNKPGIALTLGNIGGIYAAQKNYNKALSCYEQSLKIFDEIGNRNGVARNYSNFAIIYREQGDYSKAISNYEEALAICKEIGNRHGTAINYSNIANVYLSIAQNAKEDEIARMISGNKKACLQTALSYVDSGMKIKHELGDLNILITGYTVKSDVQTAMGDCEGALESYKTYAMYKDSIFNIEKDKKLTQTVMQYEFDKKEAFTTAEQEKKDIRQRNVRNSISLGFATSLLFGIVVYRQRNKISRARKRSDELLLNILPEEVADELKAKGHAEAKLYDQVTVLFTDFKGFTAISETLTPKELVQDLDACFTAFDNIIRKHHLEKIKTIGDSYMAVSGLPTPSADHALNAVHAAADIIQFMEQFKEMRTAGNQPYFEVRIGLHSGSVVAGIVGLKKFAYDIWGDTVNTASRMESSGEVGKVNISETTYELVKDKFNCSYRGKIPVKSKGDLDMYYVEGLKNTGQSAFKLIS